MGSLKEISWSSDTYPSGAKYISGEVEASIDDVGWICQQFAQKCRSVIDFVRLTGAKKILSDVGVKMNWDSAEFDLVLLSPMQESARILQKTDSNEEFDVVAVKLLGLEKLYEYLDPNDGEEYVEVDTLIANKLRQSLSESDWGGFVLPDLEIF
ncbi:MAG: hypothetical protein KZQ94_10560 [Candidatus Thiodiazotropha sp. (ex Troendleina suluensis)]|nr:hypothetical protein [Candidatus Thiodiazotropha sp. (ex Troendleina suluensis)]